jgi:hypothetical protein
MLSEVQQATVWEHWLAAEIRALHFGDLANYYGARQKWLTVTTLLLSSGAFVTLFGDWLPAKFAWLRPALPLFIAAVSIASLIEQNQKRATDAADLHFRWNRLAGQYEALWNDMYAEDAAEQLNALNERRSELSKSSLAFPKDEKRMLKWEDHVVQHRAPGYKLPSGT